MLGQPEDAGPRIAGLRSAAHRANLREAEPQSEKRRDDTGVLIEPGGEADGVSEGLVEEVDTQAVVGRKETAAQMLLC